MKVYKYGALVPTANLHLVQDQMSLAHRYYNTLIEIERNRRDAIDKATSNEEVTRLTKLLDEANQQITDVRDNLKKQRAKTKSAEPDETKRVRTELKVMEAAKKTLVEQLREARRTFKESPEAQQALAAAHESAALAIKAARAAAGLYWGTYLQVEAAVEQAAKDSIKETLRAGHRVLPRFKRWTGDGHLSVQLQNGLSTAKAHEPDTRCWVRPVDPSAFVKGTSLRERKQHTIVFFRIGSNPDRSPVFAEVPIRLHRPLPPGTIKWAHLIRYRVADRMQWFVQFVVDVADDAPREKCGHGAAGIDVGWRQKDNGDLRVAVLHDEYGGTRELVLPKDLIDKNEHVRGLAALRDTNLDKAKLDLIGWLSGQQGMELKPQHVSMWRSPGRIKKLVDEVGELMPLSLRERLTAYLKQDRHLWQWQEHERQKVLARRQYIYRCFAADVTRTYSVLAIEEMDLRKFASRGKPEDGTQAQRQDKDNRQFACISELRQSLANAAAERGVRLEKLDPSFSTLRCHECGTVDEGWNPATQLEHTCPNCGAVWDQDVNAAKNLLASALLTKQDASVLVDTEVQKKTVVSARQQRFRKNKAEASA